MRQERDVAHLGVVEVLLQVRLRSRRQGRFLRRHLQRKLLHQHVQRVARLGQPLLVRLRVRLLGGRLRPERVQQDVQPRLLDEHLAELLAVRVVHEVRERDGDARRVRRVRVGGHQVDEVPQHPRARRDFALEPIERLLHAILARLHDELAPHQPLHGALANDVRYVVLVVREAIQRERGVVLQVALVAVQQIKQRPQPGGVQDANLVVRVLRQPPERERRHLAELLVRVAQHLDQRAHGAALDHLHLERVRGGELPEQQRRLALRLRARRAQEPDDGLQRALVQHAPLDVRRGVHEVADHANRLVVDQLVLRLDHKDEHR